MTTVVITPIAEELEVLTVVFDQRWGSHQMRDAGRLQVLEYRAKGIILCQGGLGKAQFAVTAQHLLDNLASPSLAVCAGIAGSLTASARVGDVIVGTATVEHDFNPRALDRQTAPQVRWFRSTPRRTPRGAHSGTAGIPGAVRPDCQWRRGYCGPRQGP